MTLNSVNLFTVTAGTKFDVNGTIVGSITNGVSTTRAGTNLTGTTFNFTVDGGVNDTQWFYSVEGVNYTTGSPSGSVNSGVSSTPLPPALWSSRSGCCCWGSALSQWKRRLA